MFAVECVVFVWLLLVFLFFSSLMKRQSAGCDIVNIFYLSAAALTFVRYALKLQTFYREGFRNRSEQTEREIETERGTLFQTFRCRPVFTTAH